MDSISGTKSDMETVLMPGFRKPVVEKIILILRRLHLFVKFSEIIKDVSPQVPGDREGEEVGRGKNVTDRRDSAYLFNIRTALDIFLFCAAL